MRKIHVKAFTGAVVLILLSACHFDVRIPGWYNLTSPTQSLPQVYGSYSAGCLDGAMALPKDGVGYHVVDYSHLRFYGHPTVVNFIQRYAQQNAKNQNISLLISDVAQPRGGPTPPDSSHHSHQTGLDVDIWFSYLKKGQNLPAEPEAVSMVNKKTGTIEKSLWSAKQLHMLKTAAEFAEVERIFVNPAIKKELCQKHKGEAWMNKVRPWWGHSAHFHVRLACPADSPDCKEQDPAPSGDGCDATLDWWFSEEATAKTVVSRPYVDPALPWQCRAVFNKQ